MYSLNKLVSLVTEINGRKGGKIRIVDLSPNPQKNIESIVATGIDVDYECLCYQNGLPPLGPEDSISRYPEGLLKCDRGRLAHTGVTILDMPPEKAIADRPPADLYILDTYRYQSTTEVLQRIYNRSDASGTIFLPNYQPSEKFGQTLAVTRFLDRASNSRVKVHRPMYYKGTQERNLIIELSPRTSNKPIKVVCVLKSGGVYDYKYVNSLANSVKSNVTEKISFVCLTDAPDGMDRSLVDEIVPLTDGMPKWWSKIELFKAGLFDGYRVFFLDLDTVVVGNIDHILKCETEFMALKDFYGHYTMGSGLMMWDGDAVPPVYTRFMVDPARIIRNTVGGDQVFIGDTVSRLEYFQDVFPGEIVSYKVHCRNSTPPNAKIVCFHGEPKPHNISDGFLRRYWLDK